MVKFSEEKYTKVIGDSAFYGCSSLTSITLPPNSLTTIGKGAFYRCSSLTSITLPDSLTTIGDWAFSGCSSLTSITLPDSLTTIGNDAFFGCSNNLIILWCGQIFRPGNVVNLQGALTEGCLNLLFSNLYCPK